MFSKDSVWSIICWKGNYRQNIFQPIFFEEGSEALFFNPSRSAQKDDELKVTAKNKIINSVGYIYM